MNWPTSTKVIGNVYYSPILKGWVVQLAGTGETIMIFATKDAALAWLGDRLK